MKCKEILEKDKINLHLRNKKKVQKLKEKGITLIALVVTIIILLILAGVTLNMAMSGDGLFSKAKLAVNKYDVASEQEVLQQQIIEYQMNNSIEKIGEKLSDKISSVTDSNWKVIQLNNSDKNYGTNYYYVPKGTEIANYGQTKYNWVMNYETGEVINIEEYTVLDGNAGISVKDNLTLNINPVNLNDKTSWGENVTFVYGAEENSKNSGVHGTELRFDGIDDYLRIDNVEIQVDEGFTFEFYGKKYGDKVWILNRLGIDEETSKPNAASSFRIGISSLHGLSCNIGKGASESELARVNSTNWFDFSVPDISEGEMIIYVSVSVDLKNGKVCLFYEENGKLRENETFCSVDYLNSGDLMKKELPFCIGSFFGGSPSYDQYSRYDLYATRLYNRVLNEKEVNENYYESVNFHNYLMEDNN